MNLTKTVPVLNHYDELNILITAKDGSRDEVHSFCD